MNVYLESSAALRDLLEGEQAGDVRELVAGASLVVTSRLTLAEVGRVFARLRALEPEIAARVAVREAAFVAESDLWAVQEVDADVWARCARPFPFEPVRIMDAIHLATIEKVSGPLDKLVVISTDDRVRRNTTALGFEVRP